MHISRLGGIVVTMFTLWLGCNPLDSAILLRPDEYRQSERKNLRVSTKDGREIDFSAGQHRFVQRDDSLFLSGTGVFHRLNGLYVGKEFNGEIPVEQIDRIEVPQSWDPTRFGGVLLALCIIVPLAFYGLR